LDRQRFASCFFAVDFFALAIVSQPRQGNIPDSAKLFASFAVFSGEIGAQLFQRGRAMTEKQDRRRFLQASLAAGTVLTFGGANASHGDIRSVSPQSSPIPAVTETANPQVRPGRVRWHADFSAACAAGRSSGKPVLLFQMLGRLDQKFC
jgi:hypothetical protein